VKPGDRVRAKERIREHRGHLVSPCTDFCIDIEKHSRGEFLNGDDTRATVLFDRPPAPGITGSIIVELNKIEAVETPLLSKCPFCGGTARMEHERQPARTVWFVVCDGCACQGPWSKIHEGDAARWWNRRYKSETELAQFNQRFDEGPED
jgi:hypothetical protein